MLFELSFIFIRQFVLVAVSETIQAAVEPPFASQAETEEGCRAGKCGRHERFWLLTLPIKIKCVRVCVLCAG